MKNNEKYAGAFYFTENQEHLNRTGQFDDKYNYKEGSYND